MNEWIHDVVVEPRKLGSACVDRRLVALVLEPHRVSGKLETAWAVAGHRMGDRSLTVWKNIYGRRADVLRNKVAQNFKCSCKIVK